MYRKQNSKQDSSHMKSDNLSRTPSDIFVDWCSNKHIDTPKRCHNFTQIKNKFTKSVIFSKKSNQKDPEEKNLPYPFPKLLFQN